MAFFDQYKNQQYKKKLAVILPAFVLALGLNIVLFSETGHRMQSSIVSYEWLRESQLSVIVDPTQQSAVVSVHQDITAVSAIHFTLLYDDTAVVIEDITSAIGGWSLTKLTNQVPQTISITFAQPTDIVANTDIASFRTFSLTPEPRTINVSDTFFMSWSDRYELTSQGSGPF